MSWFKKSKKPAETAPVIPQDDQAEKELKARFKAAAWARCCLTKAFAQEGAGQSGAQAWLEWQEAHSTDGTNWLIRRACEFTIEDDLYIRYEPVASTDDFFSVVESLASYESLKGASLGETKNPLPEKNFRILAEKEGIIFDIEGKPHPTTADGLVLSSAVFKKSAIANISVANKAVEIELPALPITALPLVKIGQRDLRLLNSNSGLEDILIILNSLRDFTKASCEQGWHTHATGDPYRTQGSGSRSKILVATNKLPDASRAVSKALESSGLDKDACAAIKKSFALFQLHICLVHAHVLYKNYGQTVPFEDLKCVYDEEKKVLACEKIESLLSQVGYPEIKQKTPQFERMIEDAGEAYPEQLDRIIEWFENVQENFVNAAPAPEPLALPPPAL